MNPDRVSTLTQSPPEERLFELIRQTDLPVPEAGAKIHGYTVDLLWRKQRLVVEVDGYRYHSRPAAFERDRVKGAKLTAAGLIVMRISALQVDNASYSVIARIAETLARLAA
jgi:very-short-patch-repair endonuclease